MGDRERLFRVIVLGGIGMLGVAVQATACDGTTSTSPTDAGSWSSGSSSGFPMEGASSGSFPTEGTRFQPEPDGEAPIEDAGGDVMDASLVDAGEKRFVVGAGEQEARAETVRFRHALRRTGTTERGPIWRCVPLYQAMSYAALRIALALFLPIAVRLLALRDAARSEPDAPCAALSARHLQVLRACGSRPMSATPSNQEVYTALAALGGHLRSNGPPGWMVLGRAFEKLLVLEQGWIAAQHAGDVIDD